MNAPPKSEARAQEFRGVFADEATFRAWYDRTLPGVYTFVLARCGGVRSEAMEITQDVFIEAVRHRDRFDGRSEPLTWLCGIAKHKLADHFRRRSREERRHLQLAAGDLTEGAPPDPWEDVEARDAVARALQGLPASQRAVLVFHYLDRLPTREIADLLGRSESAVESLLSRARESFRRAYPRADEERGDG
jgi:RNA polymerase sigma-70 factor (ECF subfamily)